MNLNQANEGKKEIEDTKEKVVKIEQLKKNPESYLREYFWWICGDRMEFICYIDSKFKCIHFFFNQQRR